MDYALRPLPTLNPENWLSAGGLYDSVSFTLNRVVSFLQSVPVVPNSNGLFDASGNWLTPIVSLYDMLLYFLAIILAYAILARLSGGSGMISNLMGDLSSKVSKHD